MARLAGGHYIPFLFALSRPLFPAAPLRPLHPANQPRPGCPSLQLADRTMRCRIAPAGGELVQAHQDKAAVVKLRMGNLELRMADAQPVIEENVNVNRSRAPAAPGAATEGALNGLEVLEQAQGHP